MIAICSDHGGYKLKEKIKSIFKDIEFKDFGTYSEERMDYPDVVIPLAESVANNECELGIAICRTGIGVSIVANKVKKIRCALCYNEEVARLAKEHNNANIIALGADMIDESQVFNIINTWINSSFLGGKHEERINKINRYENR